MIINACKFNNWYFWETYWILQCKAWGFNLLNHTAGINGCVFGNSTSFRGKHRRVVKSFFKDGTFYADYPSIKIACANHNKSVEAAVYSITKSANVFLWLFKEKYETMSKEEFDLFVKNNSIHICNGINTRWKKGHAPHNKGKKWNEEVITKFKASHNKQRKLIFQYDKKINFIKEFESVTQAATLLSLNADIKTTISALAMCAKYNSKKENLRKRTAYNYIWTYEKI